MEKVSIAEMLFKRVSRKEKSVQADLEPLRLAMLDENKTMLEDKIIKVTAKRDYTRSSWNTQLLYEKFSPKSAMYKKYILETAVKGSIKLEDK